MKINKDKISKGDFIYKDVIDLISLIGYKHRSGNYFVIQENDGYINISYDKGIFNKNDIINIYFHKNYYYGQGYGKKEVSEKFDNFDDFENFVIKYHNKLFLKHKLIKLINKIK